jgi:hypothetical protein
MGETTRHQESGIRYAERAQSEQRNRGARRTVGVEITHHDDSTRGLDEVGQQTSGILDPAQRCDRVQLIQAANRVSRNTTISIDAIKQIANARYCRNAVRTTTNADLDRLAACPPRCPKLSHRKCLRKPRLNLAH